MAHSPDDFLTVNEAAQILRVSATTVRNWAADGKLEEHRTAGGHRRFRAAEVQKLARTVAPNAKPAVLVIDDDPAIRYVLREAFTAVGFDVSEAESGLLGLEVTRREDEWISLGPRLALQLVPERKTAKNRVHLDLVADDFAAAVARAQELGATPVGPVREDLWQVWRDPEGNEFCICVS